MPFLIFLKNGSSHLIIVTISAWENSLFWIRLRHIFATVATPGGANKEVKITGVAL